MYLKDGCRNQVKLLVHFTSSTLITIVYICEYISFKKLNKNKFQKGHTHQENKEKKEKKKKRKRVD